MADLQFCCQALGEIGVAYKNSTRALEVIICIKQEWQRKATAVKLKRPGSQINVRNGQEMQRKRRITDTKHPDRPPMTQLTQGRENYDVLDILHQSVQDIGAGGLSSDMFSILGSFPDESFGYGFLNTEASNGSQNDSINIG